jgi:hypothetical protein
LYIQGYAAETLCRQFDHKRVSGFYPIGHVFSLISEAAEFADPGNSAVSSEKRGVSLCFCDF